MVLEALILGAIQGITEFLPISSSAHLILVPRVFNFQSTVLNSNLFDSILHGGSLFAILIFFAARLKEFASSRRMVALTALSAMPAFIVGFAISPYKDTYLRGSLLCASTLVVFGIYMIVADRAECRGKTTEALSWREFLFLGAMQAVALIPGTSRSGITIASALLIGMKREQAVEVSFIMGIPVIAAAFAYEFRKAVMLGDSVPWDAVAAGFASSFVFGLLALGFLVKFMRNFRFSIFAYYRFCVALAIVLLLWNNNI